MNLYRVNSRNSLNFRVLELSPQTVAINCAKSDSFPFDLFIPFRGVVRLGSTCSSGPWRAGHNALFQRACTRNSTVDHGSCHPIPRRRMLQNEDFRSTSQGLITLLRPDLKLADVSSASGLSWLANPKCWQHLRP